MYNAKKKKKFRKYEVCILEQTKHTPEDNDFFFFFLKRAVIHRVKKWTRPDNLWQLNINLQRKQKLELIETKFTTHSNFLKK